MIARAPFRLLDPALAQSIDRWRDARRHDLDERDCTGEAEAIAVAAAVDPATVAAPDVAPDHEVTTVASFLAEVATRDAAVPERRASIPHQHRAAPPRRGHASPAVAGDGDPDHVPHTYDAIPLWAATRLAGRLVLRPRALRGLKGACYHSPELVARSLLLLSREFRDAKIGAPGADAVLRRGIHALGVRIGRAISPRSAGPEADAYYVRHPQPSGDRKISPYRLLDMHLRKGSSMNPRYCLAIYFFWDETARQVVVGWLPSHLGIAKA